MATGISHSERNRTDGVTPTEMTASQRISMAQIGKAVNSGKVTAAEVAQKVFDAMTADQFYIYSHPKALGNVQSRMDAIVAIQSPPDPFTERPEIGEGLRAALRTHN